MYIHSLKNYSIISEQKSHHTNYFRIRTETVFILISKELYNRKKYNQSLDFLIVNGQEDRHLYFIRLLLFVLKLLPYSDLFMLLIQLYIKTALVRSKLSIAKFMVN